jgi:uncharacterized repeat protein (TIGR03803 family)
MKRSVLSALHTITVVFAVVFCATSATAGTENILYNFHMTSHGQYPSGGLISDSAGNLYGTTEYGGAYDSGAVFMLSPNTSGGWTETILYSFKGSVGGAKDGWNPTGALTFDSAGNLYGSTTWGGNSADKVGTIFKLSQTNGKWKESIIWSFQQFNSKDGFNPQGGLVFDQSGNLYGTTEYGGGFSQNGCSFDGGCGTVFQLTPKSNGKWKETILYVFQGETDGEYPNDALAIDGSGNLYGTTRSYTNSSGTVFEVSPNAGGSWTETTLYSFTGGTDGDAPNGGLIFDQSGNLDGTTLSGGNSTACTDSSPCGTVFQLVPSTNGQWNEKVLYSFNNADGAGPTGKLILDQSGDLEGMTEGGGTSGLGTAFELTPNSGGSWSETVLFNFTGSADGLYPQYGVIAGTSGQLYGVEAPFVYSTGSKNGIVFQLTKNAQGQWSETILDSFLDVDGGLPQAGLIADSSGNLYGVTSEGGSHAFGTVFKLTHSATGWEESILYDFSSGSGAGTYTYSNPSTLIFDSSGNLYGETAYGGSSNEGMVFELLPDSDGKWTEKTLFNFTSSSTGTTPFGGLIFDAEGNLYGTTDAGGIVKKGCGLGCGTVFKLSPAQGSWKETILYEFNGGETDGAKPPSGVVFDPAGNLYGTTSFGGITADECGDGCGTVFKLTPGSGGTWTESVLYEFVGQHGDGAIPESGVILDQAGNLYGTASVGGNHGEICGTGGCGTVYELSPHSESWSETILYTFDGDAVFPVGGLIFDSSGNLYGTTEGGSFGLWGSVFELSPASGGGWDYNWLYSFQAPGTGDGFFPQAGVILGPSGTLYGTTADGGQENWGTVFQITP